MRKLIFAATLLLAAGFSQAGVTTIFTPGQVLPAAQLNAAFAQCATYNDLSATTGAGLVGVSGGGTLQAYLNMLVPSSVTPVWGGITTGSANAQVATPSPALATYLAGQPLSFQAGFTNTSGTATVAWSSLGGLSVVGPAGSLNPGDLIQGRMYTVMYDPVGIALVLPQQFTVWLLAWARSSAWSVTSATVNSNGVTTSATITWPDGVTGAFTADTVSSAWPGQIDAWHATYAPAAGPAITLTQSAVTRDSATGAVTAQPALTITD